MEEQILRERCEILSHEIEKTQDNKWKSLVDKTYGISSLYVLYYNYLSSLLSIILSVPLILYLLPAPSNT